MSRSQVRKWTGRIPAAVPPAALGLARAARPWPRCLSVPDTHTARPPDAAFDTLAARPRPSRGMSANPR